jgi:hypothetical protein
LSPLTSTVVTPYVRISWNILWCAKLNLPDSYTLPIYSGILIGRPSSVSRDGDCVRGEFEHNTEVRWTQVSDGQQRDWCDYGSSISVHRAFLLDVHSWASIWNVNYTTYPADIRKSSTLAQPPLPKRSYRICARKWMCVHPLNSRSSACASFSKVVGLRPIWHIYNFILQFCQKMPWNWYPTMSTCWTCALNWTRRVGNFSFYLNVPPGFIRCDWIIICILMLCFSRLE